MSAMANRTLLVIIPDQLTAIINKGEITSRYYNPGELFDEVHILMVNADQPDPALIQPMVGRAKLFLHNLPIPPGRFFRKTLGWRPRLMRDWAARGVDLANDIAPALIRCHGNHHNAYLASEIKRVLGVPYIISMHINPDADVRRLTPWRGNFQTRLLLSFHRLLERHNFRSCDCVVCVYDFIRPYAQSLGAKRIETIYNVINPEHLCPKVDYALSDPPRLLLPGRQFEHKDPSPVIRALADIPNATLHLVGDGAYHEQLKELAIALRVENRCIFTKSLPNDELCRTMRHYDVLLSVNGYGGVSKVDLEAAQVGMPVVTNAHFMESLPEVLAENCLVVDGSAKSYHTALTRLLSDEALRKQLGSKLRESVQCITPERLETRVVELYKQIMQRR